MKQSNDLDGFELHVLRETVTDEVSKALSGHRQEKADLQRRLRCYERTAVEAALGPQTIQVIRSGRRLLGDAKPLSARGG